MRWLNFILTTLLCFVFHYHIFSLYFSVNSLYVCVCEKVNIYGLSGSCFSVSVCWSVCVCVCVCYGSHWCESFLTEVGEKVIGDWREKGRENEMRRRRWNVCCVSASLAGAELTGGDYFQQNTAITIYCNQRTHTCVCLCVCIIPLKSFFFLTWNITGEH